MARRVDLGLCVLAAAAAVLFPWAFTGCTTPTGYVSAALPNVALPRKGEGVPQADGYGYSNAAITAHVYRVTYRGNSETAAAAAEDFVLLRSAELALEHGCPYFVVIERSDSTLSQTTTWTSPGSWSCDKDGKNCSYKPGTTYTTTTITPDYSLTIELLAARPNEPDAFALDAAFLGDSLRSRHQLEQATENESDPGRCRAPEEGA